jgi:hypothetical protein
LNTLDFALPKIRNVGNLDNRSGFLDHGMDSSVIRVGETMLGLTELLGHSGTHANGKVAKELLIVE